MIDEDHLREYPYCGSVLREDGAGTKSRITNSKEDEKNHRWTVYLERRHLKSNGKLATQACAGSVITDR